MATYTLRFDHLDGDQGLRPRQISGDTLDDLAEEVHRHARGRLRSRRVDVRLDEETLTGTVLRSGIGVGTFTLTATVEGAEQRGQPRVLHGYTLEEVEHLTKLTVRMDRWHQAGDVAERLDAVRFAIVEHLLTATERPTRRALLNAGTAASDALVRDEMRTHGRCTLNVGQAMPRYHAYWNPAHTPSPESGVVDRLAVAQIWPLLQPRQREALTALAATGDYDQATAVLGVTKGTFGVLISTGRRRFLTWWHEHETPSRQWRTDRRVRSRDGRHLGRARLTVSQVEAYRDRRAKGELLKALAAEAGVAPTTLSNLLRGKYKPAPDKESA